MFNFFFATMSSKAFYIGSGAKATIVSPKLPHVQIYTFTDPAVIRVLKINPCYAQKPNVLLIYGSRLYPRLKRGSHADTDDAFSVHRRLAHATPMASSVSASDHSRTGPQFRKIITRIKESEGESRGYYSQEKFNCAFNLRNSRKVRL